MSVKVGGLFRRSSALFRRSSALFNKGGSWYREPIKAGLVMSYETKEIYFSGNTEFQWMDIFDTIALGQCLVTDGLLQSAQVDEHVYHESLVHPAMCFHPHPRRVFIGGGGEGASLREVLKHSSVEQCEMVDIDGQLVENCRQFLPSFSDGAFEDVRSKLIFDDAKARIEQAPDNTYDVIILDLSDPTDSSLCRQLYTAEFYALCHRKLTENGVLITQSGFSAVTDVSKGVFTVINRTLREVFDDVFAYNAFIPSFVSEWGFNIGMKQSSGKSYQDVLEHTALDQIIQNRGLSLKWYDSASHRMMFSLPKSTSQLLQEEDRVLTENNHVFMDTPQYVKPLDTAFTKQPFT